MTVIKKAILVITVVALMSASGIYTSVSSSAGTIVYQPTAESIFPSVIANFEANGFANSTSNLMEKLGKSINSTALTDTIVSDGSYIIGSALFKSLYELGYNFYWTIAFNTSDPNGSSIYFLFPESVSNGSQPVENFLQISFPLYFKADYFNSGSTYAYKNFSTPASIESNTSGPPSAWAGYEFYSPLTGNKTVNSASAFFNVPKLSYPPSSQNTTRPKEYAEWVGLSNGFGGNNGLVQTGVAIQSSTIPNKYELWWEDYPKNNPQPYSSTSYASPGNILWASVFDGYDPSNNIPWYVNFTLYNWNTSIEYGLNYATTLYTYYAQFIVESRDSYSWQLPEFSPATHFEGGDVQLGLSYTGYQITTLYNSSDYTLFTMRWDSSKPDNIDTTYTMQWNSFGDVSEYGYPTLTWNNSYV